MSRRDNAAARCEGCRLHRALCLCSLVPKLVTSSRLLLLVHKDEARKPTNTGLLAARCLIGSDVVVVDAAQGPPVLPALVGPAALLFPARDARELVAGDASLTLVVPDGTWRQARKMRTRLPGLVGLPCVTLPSAASSSSRQLRTERREGGLSTLEAIARAFGVLEGPAVEQALLAVGRVMVDRTLWMRGALRDDDVVGGIPEAARRHDPRGGVPRG